MLKLPKTIATDPKHDLIVSKLAQDASPLWEKGLNHVITVPLTDALAKELKRFAGTGLATRGLESISRDLANEQKGLDALAAKTPQSQTGSQISRILFVASDGSERFYRECDSLLSRYSQRLLGIRLELSGDAWGAAMSDSPGLLRALLVSDKKAAARVLLALV